MSGTPEFGLSIVVSCPVYTHGNKECQPLVSALKGIFATRGVTVSIPNLPPMLLRGLESRLGLESSGCNMWHFLKLVVRGFLRVLRFPPLLHRFNGSANKIELK